MTDPTPGAYFEVTGARDELGRIFDGIDRTAGALTADNSMSNDLWHEMLNEWFEKHDAAIRSLAAEQDRPTVTFSAVRLTATREEVMAFMRRVNPILHEPLATKVAQEWADALFAPGGPLRDESEVKDEALEDAAKYAERWAEKNEKGGYARAAYSVARAIRSGGVETRS